jgi:hypothetical protein
MQPTWFPGGIVSRLHYNESSCHRIFGETELAPEPKGEQGARERLVLGVEGARDIGAVEADRLLRECLALTHKRFDEALWPALEALQAAAPEEEDETATRPLADPDRALAEAVRRGRATFIPRFKAAFDQLFERRREGKPRTRGQRAMSATTLAIVDEGDHTAQVSLKAAVQAMCEATIEEMFALNFRVRLLLREAATEGIFDNPWSVDYICDAFGGACRECWPDDGPWRPIMERLIRQTTPEIVALHRELNVLLQDRDVLPMMRVRTRGREGRTERDAAETPGGGSRAMLDKLVHMLEPGAAPAAAASTVAGAARASAGAAAVSGAVWQPDAQTWTALVQVLTAMQRGFPLTAIPELANINLQAVRTGVFNAMPALKAAVAGKGTPIDRVTVDVVAGVLDYVYEDRYIPNEMKTILGRLQIPILKAALIDWRVLADAQHSARRFFDTLAAASVNLKPEHPHDRALIELGDRLATRIRDEFDQDLGIFETAQKELDQFLTAERAEADKQVDATVPSLIAEDERAAARSEAAAALDARLAGRVVPVAIRAFLDHECIDRLTKISMEHGTEGSEWAAQLALVDDIVWSITPKTSTAAKKRLAEMLPKLLARIKEGWPEDEEAQSRRQALLSCLFDLHVGSLKAAAAAPPTAAPAPAPAPGVEETERRVEPAPRAPDEFDEQALTLVRGDWCSFTTDDASEPVLARLAWRAPQRKRILFCHRDGSTAFVHTSESLAEAFRSGRAELAIEAVPLFDRAMGRMVRQLEERPSAA